jgi:hypothetical protein
VFLWLLDFLEALPVMEWFLLAVVEGELVKVP